MFERFTERARKVMVLAQEEAGRFHHDYIGTEHILLGMVEEGTGVAVQSLSSLGVTLDKVREQVESIVGYGEEGTRVQVPFTPRAKKVLELALREAMQLGHNYVGTEHVLLGLVIEREGVAARILSNLDVEPNRVRHEVLRRLGKGSARVFLSLGSNLGDRLAYLRAAVAALNRGPRMKVSGTSKVYETEPVEVEEEQPDYLNCVIELDCGLPALELLRYCQGIEAALGRQRDRASEKAPRTLDIDVLLFGEEVLASQDLLVPHAGVTRAFNLRAIADLDTDLYIPGRGTVEDLLTTAEEGGIVTFGEAEELC